MKLQLSHSLVEFDWVDTAGRGALCLNPKLNQLNLNFDSSSDNTIYQERVTNIHTHDNDVPIDATID